MRLRLCLAAFSLILVYLALADEELRPIHRTKRNRFKMKDKSVIYNDSLEEDSPLWITSSRLPPTTTNVEVSDAESESQRLAQKMKEGVDHINMADYLNDEDGDSVKTASTPSQKGEKLEASNFSKLIGRNSRTQTSRRSK
jgi:hypothetical protein